MNNTVTNYKRQFITKLLIFIVGLFTISLGVSLTIISDFGAGAWDALNVGLSESFGLSVGTWVFIVAVLLTLASAMINKEAPKPLSLVTSIVIGIFIDLWLFLFSGIIFTLLPIKFVVFILGIIVISIGVSMYIFTQFPIGPIDYFMLTIKNKLNTSFTIAKTISELIGLVLSILSGGPIGIGTFIILFAIGPSIDIFTKLLTPKLETLINM